MTRMLAGCAVAALILGGSALDAQDRPLMNGLKAQHDIVKGYLMKSAEMAPESMYSFRPTPEVRTFGEMLGHVADSNFGICQAATGMKPPMSDVEKTMKTKAELTKALTASFEFCDKAIASMDDAKGMEVTKFFLGEHPRSMVISFNTAHNFEHYGNVVTYLRMNKMVPPSSQPSQ